MIARILSGLVGALMLLNCLWWILDPVTAAASLAMPLLVGLESNSQIGDFTSFFFTAGYLLVSVLIGRNIFGFIQPYL